MQVLLLILVAAVMLPATGEPPVGRVVSICTVLGAMLALVLAGAMHAAILRRGLDRPGARRRLERANTSMRWMQRLAVIIAVLGIVGFGFRESIRSFVGDVPLLDEALAVSPALVAITLAWWIHHPFEQRSHDSMLLRRLDEGLPVQSPPGRLAHVAMQVRTQMLILLVPFALLVLGGESVRMLAAGADDRSPWAAAAGSLGGVGVVATVALFAPAIIVRLVGARPMPPGDVRESLETMCRTTGVRVRDLLVWPTGGLVVNAAVTGLVAPLRWVMLTDGLLETLRRDEVLAVMAHELGHVRRHHMAWMAISVVALALGAGAMLDPLVEAVRTWRWELGGDPAGAIRDLERIDLAATGLVLVAVMIGFGWVSRRFERQADAFAAACLSDFESSDLQPIGDRSTPRTAAAIDARGVGAMSSALATVSRANGVAAERFTWRHGSIASRRRHLQSLVGVARRAVPIDRVVAMVKVASIVTVLLAGGWWWITGMAGGDGGPAAMETSS